MAERKINEFQKMIFSWWKKNKRDLPWRHTHDPYKILVSEIMLQQTQVSRVLPKYMEFLHAYPTVTTLANASIADVLRVWKGMGYNRRALYLKKTAQIGEFPKSEKELVKLPGVGIYTARALLVFAYNQNIAAVDTNIRKIITHFFFKDKPQNEKVIQSVADRLVPEGRSWEWHQALMDYGALALPPTMNHERRTNIPFKQSNRFYRGRIIDLLREKEWKEKDLLHHLINIYDKPKEFFQDRTNDLIAEQLVTRSKYDMVSL